MDIAILFPRLRAYLADMKETDWDFALSFMD